MSSARLIAVALVLACAAQAHAQIVIRSGTGANAAAITAVRDQFRADLGGGSVAGANGSFGGLRREINWDGVPAGFAAPNNLAPNFFNSNSPRGAILSTPGTGFQVSGASSDAGAGQPAAANFGNIDPSYTSTFQTFSPQRLFTPLGSNIFDVTFYVPGTNTPATVTGFGLVLTDVDLASTSAIQFFDAGNTSLGKVFVPSQIAGLSFLGGYAANVQSRIGRVRVTLGNTAVASGASDNNGSPRDIVVADDFIFGEPLDVIFSDGFD